MKAIFWLVLGLALLAYFRWASLPRLLRVLNARPLDHSPVWRNVQARMKEMARMQRLPVPVLWVLPEFSPNALVLRPWRGRLQVALTEGLVRALSAAELDAVLALCLTHGYQPGRRLQSRMAAACLPLARWIQDYPFPAQLLLSAVFTCVLRPAYRFHRCFEADAKAADLHSVRVVAASLQKMAVLANKVPLQRWNLAVDGLFLESPLVLDGTPLWAFPAQPSVEERRSRLLSATACESAPSLT